MNTSENDPAEGSSEASNKEEEKKESESITEAPEAVGSDDDSEKLVSSDGPEPDMDLEGNSREHDINKRVKLYRLENTSWEDKGTGFVEGVYDQNQDEAMLLVMEEEETQEKPESSSDSEDAPGPGGFLRAGDTESPVYLLKSKVVKGGQYSRQQDTLIVWTEPDGTEIALSFQDPAACANICEFISEVQQYLQVVQDDTEQGTAPVNPNPPVAGSPIIATKTPLVYSEMPAWQPLSFNNLREQAESLKASTRSIAGREKTVEFVLSQNYVKQMMKVFQIAEEIESLEDLHILCTMMTIILTLNDNGLYEYLLQEDIFIGVAGMMEYDPEYPKYKATYRDFLSETNRFKEVVKIEDNNILGKIHQTYRLHYLKDVILARVLDDPTFNILNSLLFFNQIDIISHICVNESFLWAIFAGFQQQKTQQGASGIASLDRSDPASRDEHKRNVVALLHQLMLMGKQVQAQHRIALYRVLLERGILFVCEWALQRPEPVIINQAAEMVTLIMEHDLNGIRSHCLREQDLGRRTIAQDICCLLVESGNLGLKSQMSDAIRSLLDIGMDPSDPPQLRASKGGALADTFCTYFYEYLASLLYKPLMELKDFKLMKDHPPRLKATDVALYQLLTELLATMIPQHGHRIQYFILSNPIVSRVASLLYMKEKALKHAAIRFFKAFVKTRNSFLYRHLTKNDLVLPLIEMLEVEAPRDNMLCSSCLDLFETIRKENIKPIINHIFEKYDARMSRLSARPNLRAVMNALRTRWEQNNEPPPVEQPAVVEDSQTTGKNEDDYFNETDEDTPIGPEPPAVSPSSVSGKKRKRVKPPTEVESKARKTAGSPGGSIRSLNAYGDESDSESDKSDTENRGRSPIEKGVSSAMSNEKAEPGRSSPSGTPRIKFKLSKPVSAASGSSNSGPDLGEITSKMAKKRQRLEEEEEEGGLANFMGGGRPGTPRGKSEDPSTKERFASLGSAVKDAGKKIKLNFGFGSKKGENKSETSSATRKTEAAKESLDETKEKR